MTNKHTPAPWLLDDILLNKRITLRTKNNDCIADAWAITLEVEEMKANAQLIAAAPELLAALQDILERFESCIEDGNGELDDDAVAVKTARAAINKAEGK